MAETQPKTSWPTAEDALRAIRDDARDWLKGEQPVSETVEELLEAIVYNANSYLKTKDRDDEQDKRVDD